MLDSRLLYKIVTRLITDVNWLDGPLNDWKYHGLKNELNFERIQSAIDKHIKSTPIYVVNKRTDSGELFRNEIESKLIGLLGQDDFSIWNLELTRVIEFNKIGVFRLGDLKYISHDVKYTFSYFDKMMTQFAPIQNELQEEDLDMVFSRMEIFAVYTLDLISKDNKVEVKRCFEFQESEHKNMNGLLLNALNVSYFEALLLGEKSSLMKEFVELMPKKLRDSYLEYENYYHQLSNQQKNT